MIVGSLALLVSSWPDAGTAAPSALQTQLLYFGLTFMSVGSGLLKCATTSMLGRSYSFDDPRRPAGFMVYYAGTNFGPGVAALVCGYLGEIYGWSWTFGVAAAGMTAGLVIFMIGRNHYDRAVAHDPRATARWFGRGGVGLCAVIGLAVALGFALQHGLIFRTGLAAVGMAVLLHLLVATLPKLDRDHRRRVMACLAILLAGQWFWIVYVLTGGAVNLFVDAVVQRTLAGITVPASTYQSMEPLLSIVCGPIVVWTITRVRNRRELASPTVIGCGIVLAGTCTVFLGMAGLTAGALGKVGSGAAVTYFVLLAFADMIVSPTVLATLSSVAPNRLLGLMNGLWYLCSAFAHLIAAGATAAALTRGAQQQWSTSHSLGLLFTVLGLSCVIAGAVFLLARRFVARLADASFD